MDKIKWFFASKEPRAERLRWIAKILILVGLFVALFWIVPIKSVIQALRTVDPLLFILGTLLGLLVLLFWSVEMVLLVRNQGIQRSIGQIFAINLSVKFYLLFMPTNLIAAGIRWYRFAQPEGKVMQSFVALAFFRIFDVFLTISMGMGFLLLSTQQGVHLSPGWLAGFLALIAFTWVVITRYSLPLYNWLKRRFQFQPKKPFWQAGLEKFEKMLEAVTRYAAMPARDLLLLIFSGITAYLVGIASSLLLASSLDLHITYFQLGWISALLSLASLLPFTMAEGLGLREVGLVAILSLFGISADQALAYSFLILTRSMLIALVGGVIEAVRTVRQKRQAPPEPILEESPEE